MLKWESIYSNDLYWLKWIKNYYCFHNNLGWTGYMLEGRVIGVRVPAGARLSPLHVVQAGSGPHPASFPMGTGGFFPGGSAAGAGS
jgi:hypothetical protein